MSVYPTLTRQRNLFGYLTTVQGKKTAPCPTAQLRTLLNLEKNDKVYLHLKARIAQLVSKHMDVELMGTDQRDKLHIIETELKKEFPEIFAAEDGEKKNKKQNRKQISQRPEPRTTRSQKSNEQDQISESNQRSVKLGSESKLLVVQMPQQSISQILSQSKELRAECDSLENNPGISRPEVTPSNYTVYDPKQYHAIHGFLQASMPPTTHLMDAFINFGCINADFLLAISSWPSEKIRGVLDQLPPGPDGKQITEMDKFILQYHFKEYYAQL